MTESALFIQGDNLLLPVHQPDDEIQYLSNYLNNGIPLVMADDYKNADIFEIPNLYPPDEDNKAKNSLIKIVSLSHKEPVKNLTAVPVRQLIALFAAGALDGTVFGSSNKQLVSLIRACHIAQWRHTSRYCGTCGAENRDSVSADCKNSLITPHRKCPNCGREEYPRICPAILVLIRDDKNRILLAHNKNFRRDLYSHISGFNEAGESLEDTVVREVWEEVKIKIKDIEYVKSQPWPFPNSLMTGFRARYESGTVTPDGYEIEDAQWFTKDNLPQLPGPGSLSRWMIEQWQNETKK